MWRKFTVYGLRFSKTSFWNRMNTGFLDPAVATVPTACGIETLHAGEFYRAHILVATAPTACGIETFHQMLDSTQTCKLQQYLPLAVCDEGCEAAEEQSDDEGRTSLVPDRREGKTKVMK